MTGGFLVRRIDCRYQNLRILLQNWDIHLEKPSISISLSHLSMKNVVCENVLHTRFLLVMPGHQHTHRYMAILASCDILGFSFPACHKNDSQWIWTWRKCDILVREIGNPTERIGSWTQIADSDYINAYTFWEGMKTHCHLSMILFEK